MFSRLPTFIDYKGGRCYLISMRTLRMASSILMASLVAWFGVAAAAPLHAHAVDTEQMLFLHLVADDAHEAQGVDAHGHDRIAAASHDDVAPSDDTPSDTPSGEPVLHAHGCFHAATMTQATQILPAGFVSAAIWIQWNAGLASISASPPRKPPRTFL